MTTPTKTGLLRYAVIDGKTFIVDAEGRELAQCVPKNPTKPMVLAYFGAHTSLLFSDNYDAMLSAATVDVSAAVVKVPERRGALDGDHDFDESKGWDACIDELERK